jgi:sec-independent protein translocase protein TatA
MRIGPFGAWEILLILVIAILLFGGKRIPGMVKGLGASVREFRKGVHGIEDRSEPPGSDKPPG